jgi:hypothetical protein
MMGAIRLRFVTSGDHLSALIRAQAGISIPFTPSHVEALSQDGKSYIGQHIDGGMQARPVGYDSADLMTLPDGSKSERIVTLPVTEAQEAAFYAFVNSKIGQPYDWTSIISFVALGVNFHAPDHAICSAIMTAGLRAKGCEYFAMPLTVPFHHISPRDLLLMLSSHVQIDH